MARVWCRKQSLTRVLVQCPVFSGTMTSALWKRGRKDVSDEFGEIEGNHFLRRRDLDFTYNRIWKEKAGSCANTSGTLRFSPACPFFSAFPLPPVFSIIIPQVNLNNDSCVSLLRYKPLNSSINNSNNKKVDILSPNRKMLRCVRPFVTLSLPSATPCHWCIDTVNTI